MGGRLTRGKHSCLMIRFKRLKVHSRSIQTRYTHQHSFSPGFAYLLGHFPSLKRCSTFRAWSTWNHQVTSVSRAAPRHTSRILSETWKRQIIKFSNGRRGSRQLAVKDFGVIKEDEEHSEVILSFIWVWVLCVPFLSKFKLLSTFLRNVLLITLG